MKKFTACFFAAVIFAFSTVTGTFAFAGESGEKSTSADTDAVVSQQTTQTEVPELLSISFNNAEIIGDFSPDNKTYDILLDDKSIQPTLKDYEISDENAKIKTTLNLDKADHPIGILVEIEYEFGTVVYFFNYANAQQYGISDNNLLESLSGEGLCCISPEINDSDTEYDAYIASDVTEINLEAKAQDVNAVCTNPIIKLGENQETVFKVTVTASNGDIREYTFNIKRLDKTLSEYNALSEDEKDKLVNGEKFYNKTPFRVACIAVVSGAAVVAILVVIVKKITVKAYDADEVEFFASDEES